jgi:hypothetical protein
VLVAVVVAMGNSEVLVAVDVEDKFAIRSGAVSVVAVPEALLDEAASPDNIGTEVDVASSVLIEEESVEDESTLVGSELVDVPEVPSVVAAGIDELAISVVSVVDVASVVVAAISAATTVAIPMVATIATIVPTSSGRRTVIT